MSTTQQSEAPEVKKSAAGTLGYVLRTVQDNPNICALEISSATGFSKGAVNLALNTLLEQGDIFTPDVRGTRHSPRRYTARATSEVVKLRERAAELMDELRQLREEAPNAGELEELRACLAEARGAVEHCEAQLRFALDTIEQSNRELDDLHAFKDAAIARYPDLAAKSIEQQVRDEIARQFPEYGAAAAAGELDNSLLAASIRTRIEAEI